MKLLNDITNSVYKAIEQGKTESQICRDLKLSRTAVRKRIKSYRNYQRQKKSQNNIIPALLEYILKQSIDEEQQPKRCPTCGQMVYLPCRKCLFEQYNKIVECQIVTLDESEVKRLLIDQCNLELRSSEKERYNQVRKWRAEKRKNPNFKIPFDNDLSGESENDEDV